MTQQSVPVTSTSAQPLMCEHKVTESVYVPVIVAEVIVILTVIVTFCILYFRRKNKQNKRLPEPMPTAAISGVGSIGNVMIPLNVGQTTYRPNDDAGRVPTYAADLHSIRKYKRSTDDDDEIMKTDAGTFTDTHEDIADETHGHANAVDDGTHGHAEARDDGIHMQAKTGDDGYEITKADEYIYDYAEFQSKNTMDSNGDVTDTHSIRELRSSTHGGDEVLKTDAGTYITHTYADVADGTHGHVKTSDVERHGHAKMAVDDSTLRQSKRVDDDYEIPITSEFVDDYAEIPSNSITAMNSNNGNNDIYIKLIE